MPPPSGVRYFSYLEASGYGLSAIANIRALVNAGVPVHWVRLARAEGTPAPRTDDDPAMIALLADDAALSDLPALLQQTSGAIPCDTVLAHCVPELWPGLFETAARNIGYTVWETDRPPAHWLPLLNSAGRIMVPCAMNRADFIRAGVRPPIAVVPHGRRHAWNEFTPDEHSVLRQQLGIPPGNFVFTSINAWDPRKAIPELLGTYLQTFGATDAVSLVIKTSLWGQGAPPLYPMRSSRDLIQEITAQWAERTGRPLPHIALLAADNISGRAIAQLQAITDCFVSFTHGEGWGLGAFEAAMCGTPVLITGWGGQMDYLGSDYPGALPYRMTPVPIWPPEAPSYHSSHRWASVDVEAAARAMGDIVRDPQPARSAALALQRQLVNRYAEPVIAAHLLRALAAPDR